METVNRQLCESYYDVRVICEENEGLDSVALKAIKAAKRYPKDRGK